ncbi:TonB-dependent receptor [Sphingosinicella sp. YJ22]|uniref:TonB-dependent receptor domain-containing protein n=1 Tax=Sphingosinicella sp. YJ22 TaxID=1104780 RepID=UPI0014088969|nr:TonB-dependent receptor [Sphingosinicella sp. YJ22]
MTKGIVNVRSGCAAVALIAAFLATPAAAQGIQPDQPVRTDAEGNAVQGEDVVTVTGSRIRRNPLDLDAPVVFVDQDDISRTGLNSINDVLQRLPSSGGGLNSRFNNSGNLGNPPDGGGVGAGAAEIDLRYLGSRRVLVLVDGLRYVLGASASGVPGSTDLNSIPESAIERVEVLQDGASAIYGSDAIAGVVNIITKSRQDGFLAQAQIGGYDEGDGFTQNYQLSWGNGGDGPLRVVVGGNYVRQDPVFSGERALSAFPEPYTSACQATCSSFTPSGRYTGSIFLGGNATLIAPVIGRSATPADFRGFVSPADRFNFQPFNFLQIPLERIGLFGNLRYELSDSVNFSLRALWNQRESRNQAAPLPFGIGPTSGLTPVLSNIVVSATNPFNPFGVDLGGSNNNVGAIFRRFLEGGPRRFHQTVDTIYGVASVDGEFQIGGNAWFWDVSASYGRNQAEQTMFGNIHSGLLRQALGPISGCTAPCVPFNLFGGFGSITPEMINFVTFEQNDSSEQSQFDATANLSGSLFDLPGGPVGLAVGVEYRDLEGRFDPDPVVSAGFSSDIPAQPTSGGYDVREAYAELRLPLLRDTAFFHRLELTGAARYSDYSTSGSTTTFKAQINWQPIEDLLFRGSWAEGFRAPSIGELFGTQSRFDEVLDDPCSSHTGNLAPRRFANDAEVRAACIAAGVPANGSYQQANAQISVTTGGNQALAPENSESYVFGGVYSPSWLPGLSLEVNYYDIEVVGAIQAIPRSTTVLNCLLTNDPATCGLVTRVNGELIEVQGFLQNIAAIRTDGIDVNIAYRGLETGIGTLGFTWNSTFLQNFDVVVPGPTGPDLLSREGTQVGAPAQAFPDFKSVGVVDLDTGPFGLTLIGRYVSELEEVGGNVMESVFYTDLQVRFDVGPDDRFGFAFGVNNLFDVETPGCVTCESNNFSQTAHDIPGRYFYARARVRM